MGGCQRDQTDVLRHSPFSSFFFFFSFFSYSSFIVLFFTKGEPSFLLFQEKLYICTQIRRSEDRGSQDMSLSPYPSHNPLMPENIWMQLIQN